MVHKKTMNNEDEKFSIELALNIRNGKKTIQELIDIIGEDVILLEILIDCWYRFKFWDIIDLLMIEKNRAFLEQCYLLEYQKSDHY